MFENEVVPNLAFLSICSKPNFTVWSWFFTGPQLGSKDSSLPGWVFSARWDSQVMMDLRSQVRRAKWRTVWPLSHFVDRNVDEFCMGRPHQQIYPEFQNAKRIHRGSPERPSLGFHRLALGAFFATPAVAALDLCDLDQKHWRGLGCFGGAVAPFIQVGEKYWFDGHESCRLIVCPATGQLVSSVNFL